MDRAMRVSGTCAVEPADGHKTLTAPLRSESVTGLYRVQWDARTRVAYFTAWGSNGTFYFGVGMPVPEHLTLREWDEGSLSPRREGDARFYGLFSGALCLALALLWPRTRARSSGIR
jgi:hypothetical protein